MSQGTLTHAYAYARNRAKLDAHICSIQERETRERERENQRTSGIWISFMNLTPKFSNTMPSEAAKKAKTCEMKCFSSAVSFSQCFMSSCKSTSSVEIGERKREFQGKKKKVNF